MFQYLAYGLRVTAPSPLAKLLFLHLVAECHEDGYAEVELEKLAAFSSASTREVSETLHALLRMGLIDWSISSFRHRDDWMCCLVKLPLSKESLADRKRPKLVADQLRLIERDRCIGCGRWQADRHIDGESDAHFVGQWHVDHIVPRSKGGADVEENLQLLCPRCNSKKKDRLGYLDFVP